MLGLYGCIYIIVTVIIINNNNNNKRIEWGFVCKIENKLKGELRGEKYRKMRA